MTKRFWTDSEEQALLETYPDTSTREIAERLDRTERSVYVKARSLGLKKTQHYLDTRGKRITSEFSKAHRFKPGHKPWNTGMKGFNPRNHDTRFKPGNRTGAAAYHWAEIGSERVTKEGYVERKVADTGHKKTDWRLVHTLEWEQHHGTIPDGWIVVFRDKNKRNIHIENLELITRAENMLRNSIHRYPADLKEAMRIASKLRKSIQEREKCETR